MKLIALLLVILALASAAILYPRMDDQVPIHWNAAGEVDSFMPKPWGPFFAPLLMAGMLILFTLLPRLSPRNYEIDSSTRSFGAIQLTTIGFFFCIHLIVLAHAMGAPVPAASMAFLVGGLFVALGNYMSKVPRNFFIGIRTPWTLASPDVWFRTHRLGALTFVIGGLLIAATGALVHDETWASRLFLTIVLAAAGIPVVYSYLIYRKMERDAGIADEHRAG